VNCRPELRCEYVLADKRAFTRQPLGLAVEVDVVVDENTNTVDMPPSMSGQLSRFVAPVCVDNS
jgi:hypothetical protein